MGGVAGKHQWEDPETERLISDEGGPARNISRRRQRIRQPRFSTDSCHVCKRPLERGYYEEKLHSAYITECIKGTRKLPRKRVMITGHFRAGKTSVKRRLLHESIERHHIPTRGAQTGQEACLVDVGHCVEWKKGRPGFWEVFRSKLMPVKKTWKDYCFLHCLHQLANPSKTGEEGDAANEIDDPQRYGSCAESDSILESNQLPDTVANIVCALREKTARVRGKQGQQMSVVDFAGEEGYYMTHQFFLREETAYLLVMDGTIKLHDIVPDTTKTAAQFVDFWLNSIYTHVVHRDGRNYLPKVITVVTKVDQMSEDQRREYAEKLNQHLEKKLFYRLVHNRGKPVFVNNWNKGDKGIKQLRLLLNDVAPVVQRHMTETYPVRWIVLVEKIKEDEHQWKRKPILSLEEFYEYANETTLDRDDAMEFLKVHDALGDLLYFHESQQLRDTVFIYPQQLIDALAGIAVPNTMSEKIESNQESNLRNKGHLYESVVNQLLIDTDVHLTKEQLLEVMMKFHLIVPYPDSDLGQRRFLVTSLLKAESPEAIYRSVGPALYYRFFMDATQDCPYLPYGLPQQLMSRCLMIGSQGDGAIQLIWGPPLYEPKYDYIVCEVKHQGMTLPISLQMLPESNSIKLCYADIPVVDPENTAGRAEPGGISDDASKLLTLVNMAVQKHLKYITHNFFPKLEHQLKVGVSCTECQTHRENHPLCCFRHVGEAGARLYTGDALYCSASRKKFSTKPYRMWFASEIVNTTEIAVAPPCLEEGIIPITLMRDEFAAERLKDEWVYRLTSDNKGHILIINNVEFESRPNSENDYYREGSNFDAFNMGILFEVLGFKVTRENNLKADQIRKVIEDIKWLIEKETNEGDRPDAFFTCIMSHGDAGIIYGTDWKPVNIDDEIITPFNGKAFPSLAEHPKVFLIQACRGSQSTEGVQGKAQLTEESKRPVSQPTSGRQSRTSADHGSNGEEASSERVARQTTHEWAHTLIAHSTVRGYQSHREPDTGSWFLSTFVKEVCESAHEQHLKEILDSVTSKMIKFRTNTHLHGAPKNIQLPEIRHAGFGKLYFLHGYTVRQQTRSALTNERSQLV